MLILTAFGSYLKLIESVSIGSLVGWVLWGWVPVWWCLCVVGIVVVAPNVCKKCSLTNKSTWMCKQNYKNKLYTIIQFQFPINDVCSAKSKEYIS